MSHWDCRVNSHDSSDHVTLSFTSSAWRWEICAPGDYLYTLRHKVSSTLVNLRANVVLMGSRQTLSVLSPTLSSISLMNPHASQ